MAWAITYEDMIKEHVAPWMWIYSDTLASHDMQHVCDLNLTVLNLSLGI